MEDIVVYLLICTFVLRSISVSISFVNSRVIRCICKCKRERTEKT